MLKAPKIVEKIINENPSLLFGLSNGLFNLTQLASFIQPLVEARLKKEVKRSSLVMALSRLQLKIKKSSPQAEDHQIETVTIHSNLYTATYNKTTSTHNKLNQLYGEIQKTNGFITITQSATEITLIMEDQYLSQLKDEIKGAPKFEKSGLTAVGVKFNERYSRIPGFIHSIVQQITLQNINIIEISSTYTELILYVEKLNTKLAFETIFNRFTRAS